MPETFLSSDVTLSRRLEMAEGRSNAAFVEARARVSPATGAEWIKVAGAYAMFDGVASPITQTFGLGLFEPVTDAAIQRIEDFFQEKRAPVFHEVSPLADGGVLALLHGRGYKPVELTSVMFRPLAAGGPAPATTGITVTAVGAEDRAVFARTAARGWSELSEAADFMEHFAEVSAQAKGVVSFLAELQGRPVATGALCIGGGVGLLAGASTIPEARRQGAQLALLDARLRYAAEDGCDIAMMGAAPGSASQRNAERHGFRIAYTRIKWGLNSPR